MIKQFACVAVLLLPAHAFAQSMASSYATQDGRVGTVVIACPSVDGSYTAGPCTMSKPGAVSYTSPAASSITTPNTAVTVFAAGSVATGCDFVNSGSGVLYVDLTTTAVIGSATSIPLQPGQSFHCPYPPAGAVSAIAAQAQSFVAIRY
jgi:hypothetical protein